MSIEKSTELNMIEKLMESNVHLGHAKNSRHYTMNDMVVGYKDGEAVINLDKTVRVLNEVMSILSNSVMQNEQILLVGCQDHIKKTITEIGTELEMAYVANSWKNGTLTNFSQVVGRVKNKTNNLNNEIKLHEQGNPEYVLTNRDLRKKNHELDRINKNYSGLIKLQGLPKVLIVIDANSERCAIKEAKQIGNIIIIAICDTNNNTDDVHYVIPANTQFQGSVTAILNILKNRILETREKKDSQVQTTTTLITNE